MAATCSGVRTSVGVFRIVWKHNRLAAKRQEPVKRFLDDFLRSHHLVTLVPNAVRVLRNASRLAQYVDVTRINDVLRDELWKGQTGVAVTAFLVAADVEGVYQSKVSAWTRDREPSLDTLAQIEAAYGLPQGWILWRAGYIDIAALEAYGDAGPAPVVAPTVTDLSKRLAALEHSLADLRNRLAGP